MIQWPGYLGGSKKIVGWLNRFLAKSRACEVKQVIGNGRLIQNSDGMAIEIWGGGASASGSAAVAIYKITSIANVASNYISAKKVSFDNSNSESLAASAINIAIPHELRTTVYYVDDYITVAESPTGTGVVVSSAQLTFTDLAAGRINWKFRLKSIQQDYITCRSLVINSGGTATEGSVDIYIAKPADLRGSIASKVIDGTTWTYDTYASTTYITRTAHSSGLPDEKQVVVPRYITDDSIIFAKLVVNGTGIWRSGVELILEEDSPRHWARKFDQS